MIFSKEKSSISLTQAQTCSKSHSSKASCTRSFAVSVKSSPVKNQQNNSLHDYAFTVFRIFCNIACTNKKANYCVDTKLIDSMNQYAIMMSMINRAFQLFL